MLFLITKHEVIALAYEITLSIEHKNQFYVGIILSISTIENIEFIFPLKIAPYIMLVAICSPTLYRSHIKVFRPPSSCNKKIKCVKMQLMNILHRCDIRIKE